MRFSVAFPAILLACSFGLSGCNRWQVESPTPTSIEASIRDRTIRVEQHDGAVVELVQVEVREDTLTGLIPGSALPGTPLHRVALPVTNVRRIASKRGDIRRILGAMASVPLAYFAATFLMQW